MSIKIIENINFYSVNNKIYFGELTFYNFNGTEKFEPIEADYKLGEMLELPKERKENE